MKFKLLGDVHLGREFVRNVPIHRRGDREKLIWKQFEDELNPAGCSYHICMGDLFDKDKVDLPTIVRAARLYKTAAENHPNTQFCVLAGNHDLSRDLETVSAFEVFEMIVGDSVWCIKTPTIIDNMLLCGWDPVVPVAELVKNHRAEIYFGHNDVDLRSDPFNLLPTKELAELGFKEAYTGHDHTRRSFERDGIKVHVVGSMQPYSHAEDPDGQFYVTLGLDEIDGQDLTNKCVRIRLKPGEVFDQQIDCLQLQVERVEENVDTEIEVSLGDFNLQKIFDQTIEEYKIPEDVAALLREKWATVFTSEG